MPTSGRPTGHTEAMPPAAADAPTPTTVTADNDAVPPPAPPADPDAGDPEGSASSGSVPDGSVLSGVTVLDEQDEVEIDAERWRVLTEAVVADLGAAGMALTVSFVDAATIAELKAEHLDGDGSPTDVLAFPMDEPPAAADDATDRTDGPPLVLGDIVVCPSVARDQAPGHAGSLEDELALLLVHAALHLVGHDHAEADDTDAMQSEERRLLAAVHGPLAADPWSVP